MAGHEFTGTIAALGADVTGWEARRTDRGRHHAPVRAVPTVHRGQAVAVREPPGLGGRRPRRRLRPLRAGAGGLPAPPAPGPDARQAALTEPLAVALHGITRSGVAPGDRVMVIGAGPIGALSIAALVARGIGPVLAVEPGAAAPSSWPWTSGPPRCSTRPISSPSPPGSRSGSRGGPCTSSWSARARRRPWRPGFSSWAGAGRWCWWARESSTRRSTPTASCSTSCTSSGRSSTTKTDSSGPSGCWRARAFPPTG